jgi:hypothetical protein
VESLLPDGSKAVAAGRTDWSIVEVTHNYATVIWSSQIQWLSGPKKDTVEGPQYRMVIDTDTRDIATAESTPLCSHPLAGTNCGKTEFWIDATTNAGDTIQISSLVFTVSESTWYDLPGGILNLKSPQEAWVVQSETRMIGFTGTAVYDKDTGVLLSLDYTNSTAKMRQYMKFRESNIDLGWGRYEPFIYGAGLLVSAVVVVLLVRRFLRTRGTVKEKHGGVLSVPIGVGQTMVRCPQCGTDNSIQGDQFQCRKCKATLQLTPEES